MAPAFSVSLYLIRIIIIIFLQVAIKVIAEKNVIGWSKVSRSMSCVCGIVLVGKFRYATDQSWCNYLPSITKEKLNYFT